MTRFEQIGCNYQYDATTIEEANHSFKISCSICCHKLRALYCKCEQCAIHQAHELVVAALAEKGSNNSKLLVDKNAD